MPKSPGRSGRLTAAARRTQLIDVARAVFAKRGYEATSVEEIAAKAKVSKPIVYEHFGGKEGLYAVLVDREMEHVVQLISDAIGSGTPPWHSSRTCAISPTGSSSCRAMPRWPWRAAECRAC